MGKLDKTTANKLEDFHLDLLKRELIAIQNIEKSNDEEYKKKEQKIRYECIKCRNFIATLLQDPNARLLSLHSDIDDSL